MSNGGERVFIARGADGFYVVATGAIGEFIFDGPISGRVGAEARARELAKDIGVSFDPWGYPS